MKEIIINEKDVGKEFLEALEEVLKIRIQKRKVYSDTFLDDDMLFLKYQAENKLKRLSMQMQNGELKELKENTETAKDSAIDIVNYMIFLICKINRGDRKWKANIF